MRIRSWQEIEDKRPYFRSFRLEVEEEGGAPSEVIQEAMTLPGIPKMHEPYKKGNDFDIWMLALNFQAEYIRPGHWKIEVKYSKPAKKNHPPTSHEVFHWPEFQALIKRLGVQHQRTMGITIKVGPGLNDLVEVTHTFQGEDKSDPDAPIDTTNLTNAQFVTKRPPSGG